MNAPLISIEERVAAIEAMLNQLSSLLHRLGNIETALEVLAQAVDKGEARMDEHDRLFHKLRHMVHDALAPVPSVQTDRYVPAVQFRDALESLRAESRRAGRPLRVFTIVEIHNRVDELLRAAAMNAQPIDPESLNNTVG